MAGIKTVAIAVAAALAGWGGRVEAQVPGDDSGCSVKLAGDVSTSFSCAASAAGKAGSWGLSLIASGADGASLVSNAKYSAAPTPGKYALAQATSGGLTVE